MQFRALRLALLCCCLGSSVTAGQEIAVVRSFPSASGPGPKDSPDNTGGIGPNHIVSCTDANIVIHDKQTGQVVKQMTQAEFWHDAKPGFILPTLNDPRMTYDPTAERWYTIVQAQHATPYGFFAVSESADPTQGWRGVQMPMAPANLGMKLGFDKNGVYVTFTVMTGNVHTMFGLFAIPKADAIAAGGPSLGNLQWLNNLEVDSFPATDVDPHKPADAPEFLLTREVGDELTMEFGKKFARLYLYKLTWSGKKAELARMPDIPLSRTYVSPNAVSMLARAVQPSPGEPVRSDEARRTTCVYAHGGSIFSCNGAKKTLDSRCGIFWCEVRVSDGALVQEGFVDSADYDYLVPSLAVDAQGNVGLGCTRTSATEFPSACVMIHAAGDAPGTMRPAVIAAQGTAIWSSKETRKYGLPWGNYNATCVDPADPTLFWTCQEYATSGVPSQWNTCWSAFRLK